LGQCSSPAWSPNFGYHFCISCRTKFSNFIFSGTIITECESGKKQLEELLHGGVDLQKKFIHQLVLMCEHFGMDGWLINIENKVNSDDVLILRDFVAMLTDAMHDKMPHSQVIWYDSVISTGELKWQNELNSKNRFVTLNWS
jgi:mannosyl-glycoprotein endo-beta-N-acetylglucosaminidase